MTGSAEPDADTLEGTLTEEQQPCPQRTVLPIRGKLAQDAVPEIVLWHSLAIDDGQRPVRHVDVAVQHQFTQQPTGETETGASGIQT